jgi:hypothetical protein
MWILAVSLCHATTGQVWNVPADGTLSEVVGLAVPGDTIQLAAGDFGALPAQLTKDLVFRGAGQGVTFLRGGGTSISGQREVSFEDLTLDGGGTVQLIDLDQGELTLLRVELLDGLDGEAGGCLASRGGTVVATEATFRGCAAPTAGAVLAEDGSFTCTDCLFDGNAATSTDEGAGGAVGLGLSAAGTLIRSTFVGNTSQHSGGAVALGGASSLVVEAGAFDGNGAPTKSEDDPTAGAGGAIAVRSGNAVVIRRDADGAGASFAYGFAGTGGAIACHGAAACDVDITGATFLGNVASVSGGHVFADAGDLTIADSSFVAGVSVTNTGGALNLEGGALTVTDSEFRDNEAVASYGGAIYSRAPALLERVRLCDNFAYDSGAGAYLTDGGPHTVRNLTALRNVAGDRGGALRLKGVATVEWSTFVSNEAVHGPAVSAEEATITVGHSVFVGHPTPAALGATGDSAGETMVARWSGWWDNDEDVGSPFVKEDEVDLTADPFPVLPTGCTEPIPVFEGELVGAGDPGGQADPDGSIADLGATGGPSADPDLWYDEGDDVPAMWDCAPDDPLVYPGNLDPAGDCIDDPIDTGDTGATGSGGDTGTDGTTDPQTSSDPGTGSGTSDTDSVLDRDPGGADGGPAIGVSGCGCSGVGGGAPVAPLLLLLAGLGSRREGARVRRARARIRA